MRVLVKLSVFSLCLLVALSSCGSLPTGDSTVGSLRKARLAEEDKDYLGAGQEYLKLANQASLLIRQDYLLSATAAFIRGNFIEDATTALNEVDSKSLDTLQSARYRLLQAKLAWIEHNAQRVLTLLKAPLPGEAPEELRQDYHSLKAQAYTQSGNFLEASKERVTLSGFLTKQEDISANQTALWDTLLKVSDVVLKQMKPAPPPDTFSGWMELAYLAQTYNPQIDSMEKLIERWRSRYPQHPASPDLIASLLSREQDRAERPQSIALLLPFTGPWAAHAAAVRDGFIAAHYEQADPQYQPTIRLYDTGPDQSTLATRYQQAVADGAEFVVGPLDKEAVTTMAREHNSRIPTLTLNYTDQQNLPDNFFQFGLAPEDEAKQVAERAWMDGHNQALIIIPEGDWGLRLYSAFKAQWEQVGGVVLEVQTYDNNASDFALPLRKLLNIDESELRWQRLKSLTGTNLKFEPRRRMDADFIFMAGLPRQARLLRPQLNFHYASNLPVYATSHVYSGKKDKNADRDMDGIIFCDIPMLLANNKTPPLAVKISRLWPDSSEQLARLYGMGADAYNLVLNIKRLKKYPYERYNGLTGTLTLNADNRIYRNLAWGQFANGLPRVLDQNVAGQ